MTGQRWGEPWVGLGIVVVVGLLGWIGLLIAAANWPLPPIWIALLVAWSLGIVLALRDAFLAAREARPASQ